MVDDSTQFIRRLATAAVLTFLLLVLQRTSQNQPIPLRMRLTKPLLTGINFIA